MSRPLTRDDLAALYAVAMPPAAAETMRYLADLERSEMTGDAMVDLGAAWDLINGVPECIHNEEGPKWGKCAGCLASRLAAILPELDR